MSNTHTDTRCKALSDLDMAYNMIDNSFIGNASDNRDFNVHYTEITCDSEEEWNIKITKLRTELDKRRK